MSVPFSVGTHVGIFSPNRDPASYRENMPDNGTGRHEALNGSDREVRDPDDRIRALKQAHSEGVLSDKEFRSEMYALRGTSASRVKFWFRPLSWAIVAFIFSVISGGFLFADDDATLYLVGNLIILGAATTVVGRQRGWRKGTATGFLVVAAAIMGPIFFVIALVARFMPT